MKKSQVVATLAVASAMGVVAPLANTASALKVTNNQIGSATGEATCLELNTALNFLDDQAGYLWFDSLNAENAKVTDGTYADITDGANLFINGIQATAKITFGTTHQYDVDFKNSITGIATNVALTDADGNAIDQNSIAAVRSMLAAVNGNAYYNAIKPIVNDLNTSADAATLLQHADAFKNSGLAGATNLSYNENNVVARFTGGTAIDDVFGAGTYQYFKDLVYLMDLVQDQYNAAVAGKAAFATLLKPEGLLTPAATTTFIDKNVDTNPTVVANLKNLANRASDYSATTTAWKAIYGNVDTYRTTPCDKDTLLSNNFGRVWTLASDYKAATKSDKSIEKLAEELVNHVAPVEPGEGDNNQGGTVIDPIEDDKNNGNTGDKDDNKNNGAAADIKKDEAGKGSVNKNGTPNTGVVVSEGTSATSTSALSTLIATLAIAGAGLTVLRRNKKNA